ncbi:MAG: hypothetical protein RJA22_2833 [Verrucomicrobiota bacterium]
MKPRLFLPLFLAFAATGLAAHAAAPATSAPAAPADPAQLEFFEKHIRPVLAGHCYDCHSAGARKVQGGLLLDTREGLLQGGNSGPALVPGQPDQSLLIRAVRRTDATLQMPPAKAGGPLPAEAVAHLEAWVKMGAPDPRTGQAAPRPNPAARHWAFQPVTAPAVPKVRNTRVVATPVDAFLVAGLEAKGLAYAPRADARTLIRRVTQDLTGLPPTPAEVADFAAASRRDATGAWTALVDRLLASPAYGERWGRHWLDIARYADSKGYVFEEERKYPYSYTYRDWVIRAFNEDLPYDRFVIEQIAADLLPLGEDRRPLAALGFLTLGRRFLNNPHDIIDDRIDVVTRGTMALTVACARCHDHKMDPISMKDYYGLYGVFASSHEPKELPLLGAASMPKEYPEYLAERKKRQADLDTYIATKEEETRARFRGQVGDYLLAVRDAEALADDKREALYRERKLQPSLARRYQKSLRAWAREGHPVFLPWFAFSALPASNFAARAEALVRAWPAAGSNAPQPEVAAVFRRTPPGSLAEAVAAYNRLFAEVDKEWKAARDRSPAPAGLAEPREALRQVLYGTASPIVALDPGELRAATDTPVQQKIRSLKRKVDELDATHAGAPPRAMAMADNASPSEPRIFKRGNAGLPGDKVPRQFLEILAGPGRQPFRQGSGRLELAQSIARRDNPLTARVWINRVWMRHFGAPLVRTPGDFGVLSEPPTHPGLLDYLAARFMDEGWSTKQLHRWILLSTAYQQSSLAEDNRRGPAADPGNELLWRQNRQRLDFEALRDTLLAVSGQLDPTPGGRPVDITDPAANRRTVYGFVERQNLPGLFRTFDFASPDTTSSRRFATTVPQQALFMMNSPFVVRQARALAAHPEIRAAGSDTEKIQRLHQRAFQRPADPDEVQLARQFLAQPAPAQADSTTLNTWEKYAQALLLANELVFVD